MMIRQVAREDLISGLSGTEKRNAIGQGRADEGAESVFLGRSVGAGGAIKSEMVGETEGGVSQFSSTGNEVFGWAAATEEGEGGGGERFKEHLCGG
jgi:hypothetical protein